MTTVCPTLGKSATLQRAPACLMRACATQIRTALLLRAMNPPTSALFLIRNALPAQDAAQGNIVIWTTPPGQCAFFRMAHARMITAALERMNATQTIIAFQMDGIANPLQSAQAGSFAIRSSPTNATHLQVNALMIPIAQAHGNIAILTT